MNLNKRRSLFFFIFVFLFFASPFVYFAYTEDSIKIDIDKAIRYTINNSKNIKIAKLENKISELTISEIKDIFNPTTGFTYNYISSENGGSIISPIPSMENNSQSFQAYVEKLFDFGLQTKLSAKTSTYEVDIDKYDVSKKDNRSNYEIEISYPLYKNFSARIIKIKENIAEHKKNASYENLEFETQKEILYTIKLFYFTCLLIEQKKAVEANLKGAILVKNTMEKKKKIGIVEDKDFLRASAAAQLQKIRLLEIEKNINQAKTNLLKQLGFNNLNKKIIIYYDLNNNLTEIGNYLDYTLQAVNHRKDILRLKEYLLSAENKLNLEKELYKPEINFFAKYASDGFSEMNAFSKGTTPSWMMGISFKKFFGGKPSIEKNKAEIHKLKTTIEDAELIIINKLINAIEEYNFLIKVRNETSKLVEIQKKRLEEEEKDFSLGRSTVRDIEEARDAYTNAKFQLAKNEINILTAYADILFLSGNLNINYCKTICKK